MIYWSGSAYLGFGPSAHSYDGRDRSWNPSSLKDYLEGVARELDIREREQLTTDERYHDYLITSLRTQWGSDPQHIEKEFGSSYRVHFEKRAKAFLEGGSMGKIQERICIQPESWLITDHILRKLFMD